jgi:hypothetical protein
MNRAARYHTPRFRTGVSAAGRARPALFLQPPGQHSFQALCAGHSGTGGGRILVMAGPHGREKEARRASDRLGTDRLLAFFHAIKSDHDVLAVKLLTDDLASGATLESIFLTGEAEGFTLHVKGRGRRFHITFGYAAPGIGDGGTWDVEFDDAGQLARVQGLEVWRC